jgi:cysteine desulfurase/selenocysteine lyase
LNEGDEVLITELEHHSNYVPWHFLRKSKNIKIKFAEINNDGEITLDSIKEKITNKTKIISVTHLSNVTGAILPIKEIVNLAHSKNIPVLVDGCQSAPHLKIDMQDLDCDFYAISGHKMYGPTGIGVLYAKKKWLEDLPPYQGGGGMIGEVKKEGISYGDLPNKYEAGTMATAQVIAFNESIKFMQKIGIENIEKHERELMDYGLDTLKKNNSVNIIGNPKNKGGVISFTIEGIHPHDIATILDEDGVAIRAGHHCCQILHDKLKLNATARASFGIYNTKEDIDKLNKSLENCKKIFNLK